MDIIKYLVTNTIITALVLIGFFIDSPGLYWVSVVVTWFFIITSGIIVASYSFILWIWHNLTEEQRQNIKIDNPQLIVPYWVDQILDIGIIAVFAYINNIVLAVGWIIVPLSLTIRRILYNKKATEAL